jgi:hypothetical protein
MGGFTPGATLDGKDRRDRESPREWSACARVAGQRVALLTPAARSRSCQLQLPLSLERIRGATRRLDEELPDD